MQALFLPPRGAAGGFVVTSGEFTPDARAFVQGLNVELVDGTRLFEMIQQERSAAERKTGSV
jgi:restriction system protein